MSSFTLWTLFVLISCIMFKTKKECIGGCVTDGNLPLRWSGLIQWYKKCNVHWWREGKAIGLIDREWLTSRALMCNRFVYSILDLGKNSTHIDVYASFFSFQHDFSLPLLTIVQMLFCIWTGQVSDPDYLTGLKYSKRSKLRLLGRKVICKSS